MLELSPASSGPVSKGVCPCHESFPFLSLSLCKLACTYHSFPGLKRQGKATLLSVINLS